MRLGHREATPVPKQSQNHTRFLLRQENDQVCFVRLKRFGCSQSTYTISRVCVRTHLPLRMFCIAFYLVIFLLFHRLKLFFEFFFFFLLSFNQSAIVYSSPRIDFRPFNHFRTSEYRFEFFSNTRAFSYTYYGVLHRRQMKPRLRMSKH